MTPCIVCESPTTTTGTMCEACQRSYDRSNRKDPAIIALIEWAAKRSRNALRKRQIKNSGIAGT